MKISSIIKLNRGSMVPILFAGTITLNLIGCGGSEAKKDNGFFTSGNREADQRADQRMAKDQELKGANNGATPAPSDSNRSLYDRLGGEAGISTVVDDFVPRVLADPRVNFARTGVQQGGFSIHHYRSEEWDASAENIQKLKKHFIQFIALSTGGPSVYEGREIKSAHANMHISNPEFDAAMGDLKASLDKLNVADKEQKELLSVIETTRPEIVEDR